MPVTFSADFDDTGAGLDGTVHNNAWKQAMATAINAMTIDRLSLVASTPATWVASQNNFAVGNVALANVSASTPVNLTGMVPVVANQILVLNNVGSSTITLVHESASSTATNRFFFTNVTNYALATNGVLALIYTTANGRWRKLIDA
jgi:hypothetical protein